MTDADLIQGSPEWRLARCGSLGASRIAEALAKIKTGWGASRANVMADLTVERLTGVPVEGYCNSAMQWGVEQEPAARAAYEFQYDREVAEIGLIRHPRIKGAHCSPDGLVGADGMIEIKCPMSATHIATLVGETIDGKYLTQIQWQLACSGRAWCDYVSFDPRMPAEMQLYVQRVRRDERAIADLERDVAQFLGEIDRQVAALMAKYRVGGETVTAAA